MFLDLYTWHDFAFLLQALHTVLYIRTHSAHSFTVHPAAPQASTPNQANSTSKYIVDIMEAC